MPEDDANTMDPFESLLCTTWYIFDIFTVRYTMSTPISTRVHKTVSAGRKRAFDKAEALDKAMRVFWDNGYSGTSLKDLTEALGINKPSLYAAFGNKEQLFVKALLKYDRDYRQAMLAKLEALDDPKKAITKFFDAIVADTVTDQDRKGCFLFNTALEISTHDEEVSGIVTNGVREVEAFFRRSIEVGQARGEIPKELVPQATAKALLALIVAIRVLGRGVFEEAALHTIAEEGKRLIGYQDACQRRMI